MGENPLHPRPLYIKELLTGNVVKHPSRYKAAKYYGVLGSSISNALNKDNAQTFINSDRGVLIASDTESFDEVEGIDVIDHKLNVLAFVPMYKHRALEIARGLKLTIDQAKDMLKELSRVDKHPECCFIPNGSGRAVCLMPKTK